MKKYNGFTLVELLAVIVILSIILAIAVPSITGLISRATKNAFESDAKLIIKAIDYKKLENASFDETTVNASNIKDLLKVSDDNYQNVTISENSGKIYVTIIGKNKWANLAACGTYNNMTVGTVEDCEIGEDVTAPVITLIGEASVSIEEGSIYNDAGATANDNVDGDITDNIVVTSTVNPNVVGTYTVTYNVSDAAGNTANSVIRTVSVTPFNDNGDLVWIKNFGGSSNEFFEDVSVVSDGYINVGYSYSTDGDVSGLSKGGVPDAIIVKYDLEGNVAWKAVYGGTGADYFKKVIKVSDGYLAIGNSSSIDGDLTGLNQGSRDAIIVKYDLDGNLLWKKNYGGSGSFDYFYNISPGTDGYIVVGQSDSTDGDLTGISHGDADVIMVKYDVSGNILWQKNFGGSLNDKYSNFIKVNDGYIIVGNTYSYDGDLTGIFYGSDDAYILKFNEAGNILWKNHFGGTGADNFDSVMAVDDGYVAVGTSSSNDNDVTGLNIGELDAVVAKFDLNGNLLWNHNYGGTLSDYFDGVVEINNGYILIGDTLSNDVDYEGLNQGYRDTFYVKIDTNGNFIWLKGYEGNSSRWDEVQKVISTSDGYILIGRVDDLFNTPIASFVAKYDLDGNLIFNKNYGGSESEGYYDIKETSYGYIIVGYSNSTDGDFLGLNNGGNDAIMMKIK